MEHTSTNDTDYEFPNGWGLMSDQEKSDWFTQERARRQARQQDTATAERMRATDEKAERLDTDQFKVEEELT